MNIKKEDKRILDDLSNIREEDLIRSPKKSKLKEIVVLVIGITLGLLIMLNLLFTFPVIDLIAGQLESTPIKQNTLNMKEFLIIFDNNTYETLKASYFEEQKVEFSVCLLGSKTDKTENTKAEYHIISSYQPKTYSQSLTHVSFASCSKETLIILHTHPYKSCLASQTDLRSLDKSKKLNPDALMVVMCEEDRFSVYS